MIHPSYNDLMQVVNADCEPGEEPVVNSRYSIVMATAKRARQIIDGAEPLAYSSCDKPFSTAVEELYEGKVKILGDDVDSAPAGPAADLSSVQVTEEIPASDEEAE